MLKTSFTIIFLSLATLLIAQGTDFFTGSWEEATAKAKKEDKILFVDAHTSWCGPCRRLKKEVFPLKEVGNFLKKNFIPLAMDLETPRGLLFSLYYEVSGYPTFLFIDPKGSIIHRTLGYRNPKQLFKDGNLAIERHRTAADELIKNWENRKKDVAYVINYAQILKLAEKPIAPLIMEYLAEAELSETEKTVFIFKQLDGINSPLMDELLKKNHFAILNDSLGTSVVKEKIIGLFMQEIDQTFDHNNRKKRKELKKRIKNIPYLNNTIFETYQNYWRVIQKGNYQKTINTATAYFNLLPTDQLKRKFLIQLFNEQIDQQSINPTVISLAAQLHAVSSTPENDKLFIKLLVLDGQFEQVKPYMEEVMAAAIQRKDYKTQIELRRYNKYLRKKLSER